MHIYFGDWYSVGPPVVVKSRFLVVSKNFLICYSLKRIIT